jgi:Domain of unknown function (DUF1996)
MVSRRTMILLSVVAVALVTLGELPAQASPGWINVCGYSHKAMADPIVYPGQAIAGHLHDFYGNKTTDGFSTYRSLLQGSTTCALKSDLAAYWVPAVLVGGKHVKPRSANFYYQQITTPLGKIKPFPPRLKVIAGDAHATKPASSTKVVYWGCTDGGPSSSSTMPVNCKTGWVTTHVNFPDCWDGVRTDSVDHKRHMAYSVDPRIDGVYHCPKSHPVPVPRLTYALEFPIHDGRKISLASGPAYTMHADFFNAWRQRRLRHLVKVCLNANVDCGKPGT